IGVIATAGIGMFEKSYAKNFIQANINGLKNEIASARAKTDGVLGVNIMVAITNFSDMVKTSISEGIDVIFSGAGLPLDLPKYLTEGAKTKLVPIVSSGRAAAIICKKWKDQYDYLPDAIVVEGPKAGGHLGFKLNQIFDSSFSIENLVVSVKESVQEFVDKYKQNIPIIAAGGIYTGADVNKIMQLGASGVQMGSRFVTTYECDASDKFKQTYIDATEDSMEIIKSPVGMPGRAISNDFLDKVTRGEKQPIKCPFKCLKTCDYTKTPYCIFNSLLNAAKGNMNNGYAFAGANAYMAEKIISVKETFNNILQEYKKSK
ncbi:MAG: nitronate monooxygenase, partial [Bacteroidota bacterium]|nr:nitronate monooxygenase [Bacteroidota bacterium]